MCNQYYGTIEKHKKPTKWLINQNGFRSETTELKGIAWMKPGYTYGTCYSPDCLPFFPRNIRNFQPS